MPLSNRMVYPVRSTRRELIAVTGEVVCGANDAITSQDVRGGTITATGGTAPVYTLTLTAPYAKLFAFEAVVVQATATGVGCRVLTQAVSTSRTITFHFATSAAPTTAVPPGSGNRILFRAVLSRSRVK